jgi:undecaprenyl-diphosphatase
LIVLVLGLVEGITEFIPVSSTGHLLLVEHFLPGGKPWVTNDLFNIVIQSGAVIAVVPLFRERLKRMAEFKDPASRLYLFKLFTAFFITAVGGLMLDKFGFKLPEETLPIAGALLIGGILFLVVEGWLRGTVWSDEITWATVFAVGAGQLLAGVFPGASRSGTTILLALMLGVSRPAATEFSFLVGIPTMLAAGGWKILKAVRHQEMAQDWALVALGFIVSAVVSFVVVKWLLRWVQTHTFVPFGWYRVIFGLILLMFVLR